MLKVKFKGHSVLPCFNSGRHPNAENWQAGEVREFDKEAADLLMAENPNMFVLEVQSSAVAKPSVDRSVKAPVKKVSKTRSPTKKKPPAKKVSK
jgi:hypothetical protein|tara:strand:- start:10691 stop:10972 length:282 start_codon:yes stop_codon:yes gene_type:complete